MMSTQLFSNKTEISQIVKDIRSRYFGIVTYTNYRFNNSFEPSGFKISEIGFVLKIENNKYKVLIPHGIKEGIYLERYTSDTLEGLLGKIYFGCSKADIFICSTFSELSEWINSKHTEKDKEDSIRNESFNFDRNPYTSLTGSIVNEPVGVNRVVFTSMSKS